MARDPLLVLSRLRRIALDAARRSLADRLGEQDAALARSADVAATLTRETAAQASSPELAAAPDPYARWLHRMQPVRKDADMAVRTATAATNDARRSVSMALGDSKALDALLAHAQERRAALDARRQQAALDEAAARRRETSNK